MPLRGNKQSRKKKGLDVTRVQVPLGPEQQVTYQNIQGQTVKGPSGEPKGFVLDMFRPASMRGELRDAEYFQHVYMGMGRARKLEWLLLRNFPTTAEGEPDFSVFENGPPDYINKFLVAVAKLAKKTEPKLVKAQTELGAPAWDSVPKCPPDPNKRGRFLFEPHAWNTDSTSSAFCVQAAPLESSACRQQAKKRRRDSQSLGYYLVYSVCMYMS